MHMHVIWNFFTLQKHLNIQSTKCKLWSHCQHGIKNNFILLFWFTNLMDLIVIKITVYEKIVYSNQKHMHSILKQIWQLQTYTRDYKNPTTKTIKFN